MEKDCDNCKYECEPMKSDPCWYCDRITRTDCWEPKETTPRKNIFLALDKMVDAIEDLREQLEADDED